MTLSTLGPAPLLAPREGPCTQFSAQSTGPGLQPACRSVGPPLCKGPAAVPRPCSAVRGWQTQAHDTRPAALSLVSMPQVCHPVRGVCCPSPPPSVLASLLWAHWPRACEIPASGCTFPGTGCVRCKFQRSLAHLEAPLRQRSPSDPGYYHHCYYHSSPSSLKLSETRVNLTDLHMAVLWEPTEWLPQG